MTIFRRLEELKKEEYVLLSIIEFAKENRLDNVDTSSLYSDFAKRYGNVIDRISFGKKLCENYGLKSKQVMICGRRCYVYEKLGQK